GSSPKDGDAYDGLIALGVVAEVVDDDSASVLIAAINDDTSDTSFPNEYDTLVAEGGLNSDPAPTALQQDVYQIVLTKAPIGTVIVNLTNVDGGGLSEDGQLRVVEISGTASLNSVTFDASNWNVPVSITIAAQEDFAKEATHYSRINHEIDAGSLDAFLGITLDDVINGLAAKVNGDLDQKRDASVQYSSVDIEVVGDPVAGDLWRVFLNGIELEAHTVLYGDGVTNIAAALAGLITAEAHVTAVPVTSSSGADSTIRVTADTGTLFSIRITVAPVGINAPDGKDPAGFDYVSGVRFTSTSDTSLVIDGNAFDAEVVAPSTNAVVTFSGTPQVGENWVLVVNGVAFVHSVEYGDTLVSVANALQTQLTGAGYTIDSPDTGDAVLAFSGPGLLTVSFVATGGSDGTGAITGSTAGVTLDDDLSEPAWTSAEIQLAGAVANGPTTTIGAVWTVNLNGQEFSYVLDDTETLSHVADGLADAINQESDLFIASYVSADAEIAGIPLKDDVWSVTLNGVTLDDTYIVASGGTLSDVASELATLIKAQTNFEGVTSTDELIHLTAGGSLFTIEINVNGINPQSRVTISGDATSQAGTFVVASVDGSPFTVHVTRADNASQVGELPSGGAVDEGSAQSVESTAPAYWARRVLALSAASGSVVQGVAWTLGLDGQSSNYTYTAGSNREVVRPDSHDVRIIDNDAPGVLILQTGDSTTVVEPTETVLLGSGYLSASDQARLRLTGVPGEGETWTVILTVLDNVNGQPQPITYQASKLVASGETLTDLLGYFALKSHYFNQDTGHAGTLEDQDPSYYTWNISVEADPVLSDTLLVTSEDLYPGPMYDISGAPFTLVLTVNSSAGDIDYNAPIVTTYTASASAGTLEITNRSAGAGISPKFTAIVKIAGSSVISDVSSVGTKLTLSLDGQTVTVGQLWEVELTTEGQTNIYSYQVESGDSLSDVLLALAADINDLAVVKIVNNTDVSFASVSASVETSSASSVTSVVLGGTIKVGEVWTVTYGGLTNSVTVGGQSTAWPR
ncbi:MAG: hypothetical protein GY809_32345, partial [Planctomycetes bacterium]|nr:hypothetical protein [Planctomycetota bacterium]